ncbi:hypothetical protein [Bradyrhizobium tunisiense]|uniref:hypothetical protein n=1 Tax=Bradyrhizobium tunisiense TaxID=3278709 RepID=UPI0035DE0F32
MANPQKGEVSFEALGRTFTMRLGTNARALVEGKTGLSWATLMKRPEEEWRERDAIIIMWAGLYQHHKLTEEEVGDLLDEIGSQECSRLLLKAFGIANPPEVANGATGPRPRRRQRSGTGTA